MKRLLKVCAFMMLIVVLFMETPALTSMANNSDTSFVFVLNGIDSTQTSPRRKENDTSSYMYCTSCNGHYVGSVWGGEENAGLHDCSGGYRYYFAAGYKRFMYNYVYELRYPLCSIVADPSTASITARGVWSPDSVYQAGVNPPTDYIQ